MALIALILLVALVVVSSRRLKDVSTPVEGTSTPASTTVRAHQVSRGAVQSWVFAEGTARSVRREYLTFENPGRVSYVLLGEDGEALREGTSVTSGTVLARQDTRTAEADIESAQASLDEASTQVGVAESELSRSKIELELAQKTRDRFSLLLKQNSASKQEFDEAQTKADISAAAVTESQGRIAASRAQVTSAKARHKQAVLALEKTELIAPIDGIVAYVNVEEGYYFTPSLVRTDDETAALQTVPVVLIDPSAFEVIVNIPSFSRGRVKSGQQALVLVDPVAVSALDSNAIPEEGAGVVRGVVFSVNPAVSPGGRAVQVKVRVEGKVDRLEDGLFVSVWLAADSRTDVLRIPVDAVLHEDNRPYVFVIGEDGVVSRRDVTLGLREFSMQEVLTGLTSGEQVVTDGRFRISEGVQVRVLEEDGLAALNVSHEEGSAR